MKKRFIKFTGLILAILMFVSAPGAQVLAAEYASDVQEGTLTIETAQNIDSPNVEVFTNGDLRATTFTDASIIISCSSEGLLAEFVTSTNKVATTIGVKDIVFQKKVWYGWTTVGTATGSEKTNTSLAGHWARYNEPEIGATYRVTCVHYADVDGYRELSNNTGEFVFTY